jgi:hypothetical protein
VVARSLSVDRDLKLHTILEAFLKLPKASTHEHSTASATTMPSPILYPEEPTSSPHSEDETQHITLPKPASSPGSRLHQRSRTAIDLPPLFTADTPKLTPKSSGFFPFLKNTRDRSLSPERVSPKEAAEFEVDARNSRESSGTFAPPGKNTRLSSWFNGTSDPVNITLVPSPAKERPDLLVESTEMWRAASASNSTESLTQRPLSQTQKRPSLLSSSSTTNNSTSRFGFFRKASQPPEKNGTDLGDELANLDVTIALYPGGSPTEFSPAALKNLHLNAEGILARFQKAYQENLRALRAVTSAKLVQADELEATQTRNEHLKLQLTDMAERAAEQEKALQILQQELELERLRRRDEDEAQKQSGRVVPGEVLSNSYSLGDSVLPHRRKNRVSEASSLNTSESGISSADSVFSEASLSPYSPMTSAGASPVLKHIPLFATNNIQSLHTGSPRAQTEPSECMRCRVSPSEAWAVVDIVQLESRALKHRIAELESAQEDALDFLSGLGMSAKA